MLKGPPKNGPTLPKIGKGYIQANITEIRRIVASLRFRLERVATAGRRVDDQRAIVEKRKMVADKKPKDKKADQHLAKACLVLFREQSRLANAEKWAAFTDSRLDLYLGYALTHTLKNNSPQAKSVWGELRLLEQQRKWEKAQNYAVSFVAFLRKQQQAA